MKAIFCISAVAVLLTVACSPCCAEFLLVSVSKERAKELGMEVRSQPAGPNLVCVELEFKAEGELKNFSLVNLRLGEGDNPQLTAPLRKGRSKPGRVAVSFTADRAHLDSSILWVMPEILPEIVYQLRMKDFVEPEKGR
jgi:hypothetical protein